MISMLVKKSDSVTIEVFVYENNGQVEATYQKSEIPKHVEETETVVFTFRKPNFADSNNIMKAMQINADGATGLSGLMDFRFEILRLLLIDWDLKNDSGNKLPHSLKNINSLQPAIASAAVDGVLDEIKIS